MNSVYFKSIISTLLLTLIILSNIGQSNLILVNSSVSNGLTPCLGTADFVINLENPSPFTIANDTITITLPNGINYIPNSATNSTEVDITDLENPVFVIPDLNTLSSYSFSIQIQTGCDVQTFIDGGGTILNNVLFDFDAINTSGAITPGTLNHQSNVYAITIPNLSITNITNQSFTGSVGDVFDRCITIINGGSGPLSTFTIEDQHGSGVLVNSVSLGTNTTTGFTETIVLNGADFSTVGNGDIFFDPGESITICENISIVECSGTASFFSYYWGCNGQQCQTLSDGANIVFPGEAPHLDFIKWSGYTRGTGSGGNNGSCFGNNGTGDFPASLTILNDGTGTAYNAEIDLFNGWSTGMIANYYSSFNLSSFSYTLNGGASQPLNVTQTYNSSTKACLPANPIGRLKFLFDSIQTTDTIVISWNHYTCCQDICTNTERKHLLGWRFQGTYENKCAEEYPIVLEQGIYTSYYRHTMNLDQSPGTLFGTSTGTMRFLTSNFEFPFPNNSTNRVFWYEIILPPCLSVDPTTFIVRDFQNTIIGGIPDSVTTNGDTIRVYYDRPVGGTQSTVSFDIQLDCSTCGTTGASTVELNSYFIPDRNCGCEMKLGCTSGQVELVCPTPCEGISMYDFTAQRINFGLPDNDNNGIPDGAGIVNQTLARPDRLMYGDTLGTSFRATVNRTTGVNWNYIYARTSIENVGNRFGAAINSSITVYDASTATYFTCNTIPAPTITTTGTTRDFVHELDLNTLTSNGCFPAGYVLDHGDSIIFNANYVVNSNVGGAIIAGTCDNMIYATTIQNPAITDIPNIYGCPNIQRSFSVIGYYTTSCCSNVYETSTCGQFTIYQNYYLSIGPCCNNYAGGNLFPFEYRHWNTPSLLQVTMPDDYTYVSAKFNFVRTTGTLSSSSTVGLNGSHTSGYFDLIPSNIVGNTYDFDVSQYFGNDPINDSILVGDDGYHGTLQVVYEPNCQVADSTANIRYRWEFEPTAQLHPTSYTVRTYTADRVTYNRPNVSMQTNLVSVNTANGNVEWDLMINNSSALSDAMNIWFGAPTTGTILADSLFDISGNTMLYPSANGIFEANQLLATESRNYKLYTHINSCFSDSIKVYFGWDCTGYPTDVSSYPCDMEEVTLYITPLMPELSNTISTISADTIGLCDTAEFEIEVRDYQLGNAYNVLTDIYLPSGMFIAPGTVEMNYLTGYTSVPDPTLVVGNTFRWDIPSVDDTISLYGLSGVLDNTRNSFKIKFKCYTDCDFVSGSRVSCKTTGNAFCGAPRSSNIGVSNQVFIGDALPPYLATININTTYITPCLGGTPVEIEVINNGPQAFNTNDSISVVLGNGLNYINASFIGQLNPPTNGIPQILGNSLNWKLPAGVGVGDTCRFNFQINGDPNDLLCGITQVSSQITTYGNALCSSTGINCNIDVATADTLRNVFVFKGYLNVSNSSATSIPNPPSGETVTVNFDINNTGETISTGTNTIVQYYNDDDNNGVYSTGDTYLTRDTIIDALTANTVYNYTTTFDLNAGNTCNIIAVIDTALNPCTCTPSQILINIDLLSPTTSHILCSGETVNIGNDPINTYTYTWNPTIGLTSSTIAQPNFSKNVVYPNTENLTYIRTINKQGCFATDTVLFTIYSTPTSDAGTDIDLCNTYTTSLAGSQPQGTATGMWTVEATHTQPSAVTFTDATLYNTSISNLQEGTYRLVWTVTNGTCTSASDTMEVHVYDQPTSNANIDQSLCNIFTTTLAGNTPPGTANGLWTMDATHVQPSVVTFADPTLFNTNIGNLQEGAYQLVWTVSNGSCTPATDTVAIYIYDQPISNAGIDINLCNNYTTNLAAVLPPGTETGIWTEDASHTQPSAVTFTDATQFNTNVSNLQEGTYRLVWAVSNGTCTPATDTMVINVYDQPTSDANIDQDLCNIYTTTLSGNTPLGTATGMWTMDASHVQPSVVTFATATSSNSNISNLQEGTYQLIWSVSNGTCTPATDTVIINVYDQPLANANVDQDLCNIYTTSLAGNTPPGTATGMWSMDANHTQPSVVTFTDATQFNTNISNLQEGTYQLIWTVSNGTCTPATDTVVVNVFDQPNATAGADQDLCNIYTTTLAGNTPPGTANGLWTMDAAHTQPSVVTFTDATQFNTNISNLQEGTYQLIWTISNGTCTPHTDTVVVNVFDQPNSIAGADQDLCNIYTTTLAGNTPPGTATGMWSMDVAHTQPSVVTFADAAQFNTNISNLQEGTYQLIWTVSNGTCTPATDTVVVNVYDQPLANANVDQDLCNVYTTTLAGNTPPGTATGIWTMDAAHTQPSVVTFTDATQFNTNISNLQEGTYQLIWTISNGTCTPHTDTVVVNVFDQPNATAGADQDLCNIYTTTLAGNTPPGTATGMWSMDANHTQPSVVTFTDATQFNTNISNLQEGTYQLIWTVSNGTCTPATDTVVVNVFDQPNATAGADQDLCNIYTTTLAGNTPPGTATGMWSMDANHTQPSVVTFTDATQFNTNISNLQEGTYQLIWTVSNGTCTPATDTVVVNVFDQPNATAGADQDLCNIYTTTLAGNTPPGTATGMWSMDANHTQPSVVTFTDATQFNTNISNLQEGTYQLIWTISNGTCTPHTDTVVINVFDQPNATAGTDQDLCNTYTTTLAGNTPPGTATGMWSMDAAHTQPSLVTFTDATQFNTNISNLQEGTYQLIWTVSNGTCTPHTDTVVINVFDQPNATAGADQDLCNIYTTTLAGNTPPGTATGMWSMDANHTQPSVVTFADATLFNTNISNLQEGTYQLIWTMSNGTCASHTDTVVINVFDQPNATAGADQDLCNIYTTTLAGNTPPGIATGTWSMDANHTQPSVVTFTDATQFNTNISNLQEGTYQLIWTVSNGTCTPATDTVVVNVFDQPNATAGADQDLCNIYTTTLAGNTPPGTATGTWSMDAAHTQPSVVTFADATQFNTNISNLQEGTYQLIWTISNGTCTPRTDTVVVNVFDQPNATAGADQDLCNVYTTTLVGNTPPGTATGMWTMDPTHTQPSVVTFTDATQFNTNISNLQEGTYQLIWTVSNGTCTPATDTVIVNVFDQPNSIAGADQDLCNIYTTTLAGNTPPGTATGMWSMDVNYTQPSLVTFTDATQFNTNITNLQEGTYQLIWTVSNGTCTPATDTVVVNVYDQPLANANVDQDLCNIYTTTLAGNTPPGTATGTWSMDAAHTQPSVVTFADATQFNTNISNLQEGTYQLIWTMSNGTCTPHTDTVVINVFDQPNATAGADQDLCNIYTTTLAGYTPPGTATGMWSMDAAHTQPSVVTFADATQFNTNISNLQEGTYQLIWTVSNGTCTPHTDTVVINVFDQPNATAGADQDLCNIYTTTLAGNTPPGTATGMWSMDANHTQPSVVTFADATLFNTNISNLQEGTYQLIWTMSNGTCTPHTDTVVINVFDQPNATAGADQDLCNIYTTTLAGNTPPGTATGMWSMDAAHTQPSVVTFADATQFNTNISNLQEGTYQLIWTMSNGTCASHTDTVVINVFDQPNSIAGADQDLCNIYTTTLAGNTPSGTATGMWSMDAAHTQPSVVTFADATQFNTNISNLQEGTYQLIWTMSNGTCTPHTDTVVINVFDQPNATAGADQDLCNIYTTTLAGNTPPGTATGMWSIDAAHTQPSVVTFTDVTQFNSNISNLQEGTYQLIWTMSNGTCTPHTDTVVINVFDQPNATAGADQDLCNIYTTTLAGNTPPGTATGMWSMDAAHTQPSVVTFADVTQFNTNISNLQEGTYQLIWTMSNGTCTPHTDTVVINVFDQPNATAGADQDLCNIYTTTLAGNTPPGTATGMWTMDPTHTQPSVVTFADATQFNTNISNLQEGTYQLIWTMSNGTCASDIDLVEIRVYNQPASNAGLDQDLCNTYSSTLTANAPTGTATGFWLVDPNFNNPSFIVFSNITSPTSSISNLQEGTYQLIWILSNGSCTPSLDTIQIRVYDQPNATAGADQDLCNVYTTTLAGNTPTGTATGMWTMDVAHTQPSVVTFADATQFNTNISNLQEGTYQLIWTMSNGTCTPDTDTVVINVYDQPNAIAGANQNLCGTYTTTLSGNAPSGTATGMWAMNPAHIQPSVITFADATQFNTNISNLQEGTYQLTWTISNGTCTPDIDIVIINVYDEPNADAGNDQNLCNTSSTILSASPPPGTATGVWSIDANYPQPSVLNFTNTTQYNTDINNLQEGTYQLIWTISNGTCSSDMDTIQISVHDLPSSNAGADQDLCNIYATTLAGNTPLGTASGLWSLDPTHIQPSLVNFANNTQSNTNISDLQEGTYKLIWTVSNGSCTPAIDTVEIRIYDTPNSYAGVDIDLCNIYNTNLAGNIPPGTATGLWTLDASHTQPSTVTFDDPTLYNANVSSLQEGTYKFVWTINNGNCLASSNIVEVRVYDQPIANTGADITICDIGDVFLEGNIANGTSTGSWGMNSSHPNPSNINFTNPYNNTTVANTILEGEYQFVWTLTNGTCPSSSDTVSVLRFPRPIANFFQIDYETCPGECIDLTNASIALPPYSITGVSWSIDANSFTPFSTLNDPSLCIEASGIYDIGLIVTSSNGCTDTIVYQNTLTVNDKPISNFSYSPNSHIVELDQVQFTDESIGTSSVHYNFGDGNSSNIHNPINSYTVNGNYTIMQFVENNEGCVDSSYQSIVVTETENLFVPNGFSPDGNGHNDIFLPTSRGLYSDIHEYSLIIFDRWGNIIFETNDTQKGWDGTSKNIEMPIGVYVWQISYKSILEDKRKTDRGHVTLVR